MKRVIAVLALSTLVTNIATAQDDKKVVDGFIQMEGGLEYKLTKKGDGDITPKLGDYMELNLITKVDDSVIFNTADAMEGKPAPLQLARSNFKGDLVNVLALMHQGDEVTARISIDSMLGAGVRPAPWMRPGEGQKMVYEVEMVTVKPAAVKAQEEKDAAEQQKEVDDKLIQDYLAKESIKAQKTASGLYYIIERKGEGDNARQGQNVAVNYTGALLDGTVFDSNVDPAFGHVEPFTFPLGRGSVIRGWDEGIGLLNKGAKGKLFIPSGLAYGSRPNGKIPANAVLIFDVELVNIESMEVQELQSTDEGMETVEGDPNKGKH